MCIHVSLMVICSYTVIPIQLRLTKISDCLEYSQSNSKQKVDDITNRLVQEVVGQCQCQFDSRYITDSGLRCFDESPQHITYRAVLSETNQTSTVELGSYIIDSG